MARPGQMDNAELREMFAQAYADGATRQELAEVFNVHKDTISGWVRRPDVQQLVAAYTQQRINRITRKIDSQIEARLGSPSQLAKMDVKDLLAIRRELLPQRVEVGHSGDSARAELEAWALLDEGHELEPGDVPLQLEAGEFEEDDDGEIDG